MDERIHRALDGELARELLTPEEEAALAAADAEIAAITRAIPMEPLPDLGMVLLQRIAAAQSDGRARAAARAGARAPATPGSSVGELIGWIWTPRPMPGPWRHAYGFAAALTLALAVLVGRGTAPARDVIPMVFTQFQLNAPEAREVALAGDFTNWQPAYRLTRADQGVWTVVVPLEPGIHNYAFVIDGERWVADPNAPAFDDGFGGLNSRLAVLTPDRAES